MIKLIFEGELPSFNDEIRKAKGNTYAYAATKKKKTKSIAIESSDQFQKKYPDIPTINEPVHISLKWFTKDKRKDADNVYFAKKYILDGLVKGRVLEDDRRSVVGPMNDNIFVDKKRPRVEVLIYPLSQYSVTIKVQKIDSLNT